MTKITFPSSFLLQRIIFPRRGDSQAVKNLYYQKLQNQDINFLNRTSGFIKAQNEISFETYFNAFPASYWRRWTRVKAVTLQLVVTGSCRVEIYKSKVDGSSISVTGADVGRIDNQESSINLTVSLTPFEDGGWLWFDVVAITDTTIKSAKWILTAAQISDLNLTNVDELDYRNKATVGIPTFNRPDDAIKALSALAQDETIFNMIEKIIMPDQGSIKVEQHPDFRNISHKIGAKLQIYHQPNLGGSGGYSRIMLEALKSTTAPYIIFMDDDIIIEPDSIQRALAFATLAKTPMLVGGQMLNLQEPSRLHSMGEVVDKRIFMWTSAENIKYDHDFSCYPLNSKVASKDLHRRVGVDYNGWWMCTIPRVVAQKLGQPLPLFIKWDDADYGLRAAAAGYPTATIPGIAIWHMAWSDKDDAIDWQAYFHLRNRLIVAALHHEGSHIPILVSSIKALLKHLLCLEYSTVAIQMVAIEDFLAGPQGLFPLLPTALEKIKKIRATYSDAVILPSAADLPQPSGFKSSKLAKFKIIRFLILPLTILHNFKKEKRIHWEVPQANFSPRMARWFTLGLLDGATVTTANGAGVVYRKRNRAKMLALLKESLKLHLKLLRQFVNMKTMYRDYLPNLISRTAWEGFFNEVAE